MQNIKYVSNTRTGRLDDIPEPFRRYDGSTENKNINTTEKKQPKKSDVLFLLLVFLLFYDNM